MVVEKKLEGGCGGGSSVCGAVWVGVMRGEAVDGLVRITAASSSFIPVAGEGLACRRRKRFSKRLDGDVIIFFEDIFLVLSRTSSKSLLVGLTDREKKHHAERPF